MSDKLSLPNCDNPPRTVSSLDFSSPTRHKVDSITNIDEALDNFALTYTSEYIFVDSKLNRGIINFEECLKLKQHIYDNAIKEVTQSISKMIEEIIGECDSYSEEENWDEGRNDLRCEQREKAIKMGFNIGDK